jgi:flagellar FliL protein
MADGKEEQNPEDAEAAALAATAKKKKIIIAAVAVLVLLLLGGGIFFFSSGDKAGQVEGGEPTSGEVKEPGAGGKPADTATVEYFTFKPPFVVNFFVAGKQRYLQISLTAMTREPDVIDALGLHTPLIRNKLVMLISGESLDELQTLEGKQQLQEKLLKEVQEVMQQEIKKPGVEQILFDSFIIQ